MWPFSMFLKTMQPKDGRLAVCAPGCSVDTSHGISLGGYAKCDYCHVLASPTTIVRAHEFKEFGRRTSLNLCEDKLACTNRVSNGSNLPRSS
jgi:hypothetical protein